MPLNIISLWFYVNNRILATQQLWTTTVMLIILANMCFDSRLSSLNNKIAVEGASSADECQVTPVIHVLQYPGCVPKPIPSFACTGRCASYIQVNMFYKNFNQWYSPLLSSRYQEVKFGKWNARVCVVKNRENVKLQFLYFVLKQNLEKGNLKRFENFFFVFYNAIIIRIYVI